MIVWGKGENKHKHMKNENSQQLTRSEGRPDIFRRVFTPIRYFTTPGWALGSDRLHHFRENDSKIGGFLEWSGDTQTFSVAPPYGAN